MVFNIKNILGCIASCDERIASIESNIQTRVLYDMVLGLAAGIYETEEEKLVFQKKQDTGILREIIRNYENNIKLIKVEKLMYGCLGKGDKGEIFSKLLAKYDELMTISYELGGNLVRSNGIPENEYLEYCQGSLKQREFISKICNYGKNR